MIGFDSRVASRPAALGPAGLRTLDAIHLATALELGAELTAFVSYDDRLSAAADALSCTPGMKTAISIPDDVFQDADLDVSAARRPLQEARRVNVDFPSWMVESLDREAQHLGVTRQSVIKMWIAERLEKKAS